MLVLEMSSRLCLRSLPLLGRIGFNLSLCFGLWILQDGRQGHLDRSGEIYALVCEGSHGGVAAGPVDERYH